MEFPKAFEQICEEAIQPTLERTMRQNMPGWLEVVAAFKGMDLPGLRTDPDPTDLLINSRRVILRVRNFPSLWFIAWNPDVKVVRQRHGEEDEHVGTYPLRAITAQFVEDAAQQFLDRLHP
ncbi:MAG TPA: hypothetical protein VN812_20020 [Candidatus Acidoferrales bacterium]|nr:hypothetical protein [Candidatus Acidoferrales bacterium]